MAPTRKLFSPSNVLSWLRAGVKSETHNVKTVRHRMMTNKSVERLHVQQERVADCGYVGLQAFVAMVGPICKQVHCVES